MKDLQARSDIYRLQLYRESHDMRIEHKADTTQLERVERELVALRKAFNDLMELVVAKTHLVDFDQFGGPHTLDVERSAVEMLA